MITCAEIFSTVYHIWCTRIIVDWTCSRPYGDLPITMYSLVGGRECKPRLCPCWMALLFRPVHINK